MLSSLMDVPIASDPFKGPVVASSGPSIFGNAKQDETKPVPFSSTRPIEEKLSASAFACPTIMSFL